MKLGRNEKCWCGSGLKFKRCHESREREKPISKGEVMAYEREVSKRETCYAPQNFRSECSDIIKAHTVSKSSGLTDIADSTNHVLGIKFYSGMFNGNRKTPKLERIGINKASTFKGFCGKHDNQFFSIFEDHFFTGTKEQCFGLTYRALAKEIYENENSLKYIDFLNLSNKGKYVFQQQYFRIYMKSIIEIGELAIRNLNHLKSKLDKILLDKSYESLNFLVIESSNPIPIVISSVFNPTYDFEGKHLQMLAVSKDQTQCLISNAFSSNKRGFVLFSWLDNAEIINSFIDSLLRTDKSNIFSTLVRFFFGSAENVFVSPTWWNSLNHIQKNEVEELIMIGADPSKDIPDNIFINDNIQFKGWEIDNIYRV